MYLLLSHIRHHINATAAFTTSAASQAQHPTHNAQILQRHTGQIGYSGVIGWNLGGKEEILPTRLPILHIPNPDREALPTSDMNVGEHPSQKGPFHPFPPPPPAPTPWPTLKSTLPGHGLNSRRHLPRQYKTETNRMYSVRAQECLKCVRGKDSTAFREPSSSWLLAPQFQHQVPG